MKNWAQMHARPSSPRKKAVLIDCLDSISKTGRKSSNYDAIILWNAKEIASKDYDFLAGKQVVSVPDLIAVHGGAIHGEYLEWIYCASFFKTGLISNIDKLRVNGCHSLWWGSLIFEKCNFQKSPHIHTALKIIALSKWLNENPLTSLEICATSFGMPLRACLKDLCRHNRIDYVTSLGSFFRLSCGLIVIKALTPVQKVCNYIFGVLWLVRAYISAVLSRSIDRAKSGVKIKANNKITFVTYTAQAAKSLILKQGLCSSAYWGKLPGVLRQNDVGVNWIYIFSPDRELPSLKKAAKFFNKLDATSPESQAHLVLDSLFNFSLLRKCIHNLSVLALRTYSWVAFNSLPPFKGLDISLLYHHDYLSSSVGVAAARNLFYSALFEDLFSEINPQNKVVYLQENMDWEYSLIEVARKYHASKIIGFPHSSISFWDLRYSYPRVDPVAVVDMSMPIPDEIAISGNLAKESFLEKNPWLASKLVDVEALRFGNPRNLLCSRTKKKHMPSEISILMLGVYSRRETESLMLLLGDALPRINSVYNTKVAIKFHPLCDMREVASRIFRSGVDLLCGEVHALQQQYDFVLCGAMSSACIDVAISGSRPFVYHAPSEPIINPLYGTNLATFVSGPDEFSSAVMAMGYGGGDPLPPSIISSLFNTDPGFKMWMNVIAV